MKSIFKKNYLILFLVASITFLTSCRNDDTDVKNTNTEIDNTDAYVGSWNALRTGIININYNGQTIQSKDINEERTVEITKVGENELMIDGELFQLGGTQLTREEPLTETVVQDGVTINLVINVTGTIMNSSLITFNEEISGTWEANGAAGTVDGNSISKLTR